MRKWHSGKGLVWLCAIFCLASILFGVVQCQLHGHGWAVVLVWIGVTLIAGLMIIRSRRLTEHHDMDLR